MYRATSSADLTCVFSIYNYKPQFLCASFAWVQDGYRTVMVSSCVVSVTSKLFSSVLYLVQLYHTINVLAILLLQVLQKIVHRATSDYILDIGCISKEWLILWYRSRTTWIQLLPEIWTETNSFPMLFIFVFTIGHIVSDKTWAYYTSSSIAI